MVAHTWHQFGSHIFEAISAVVCIRKIPRAVWSQTTHSFAPTCLDNVWNTSVGKNAKKNHFVYSSLTHEMSWAHLNSKNFAWNLSDEMNTTYTRAHTHAWQNDRTRTMVSTIRIAKKCHTEREEKSEFDFTKVTRPLEETAFLFYVSQCGNASHATH